MEENIKNNEDQNNSQKQIAGSIIIAGLIIAGAILLKDNNSVAPTAANVPAKAQNNAAPTPTATTLSPITKNDNILGNSQAKVAIVMYEDFQCPFCGKFFSESETAIRNTYVKNGDVQYVSRDWAFLGPESIRSSEAARCAKDQGKFWEFHDYLYSHQNGENKGAFSDTNLKSFAKNLGLNTATFNSCFDSNKYAQAVDDSKSEGIASGVTGTPKGFILRDGKIVATINGAEPYTTIKTKIDSALK